MRLLEGEVVISVSLAIVRHPFLLGQHQPYLIHVGTVQVVAVAASEVEQVRVLVRIRLQVQRVDLAVGQVVFEADGKLLEKDHAALFCSINTGSLQVHASGSAHGHHLQLKSGLAR